MSSPIRPAALRKRSSLAMTLALCALSLVVQGASPAGPVGSLLPDDRSALSTPSKPTPRLMAVAPTFPMVTPEPASRTAEPDPPSPMPELIAPTAEPATTPTAEPTAGPKTSTRSAPAATARPAAKASSRSLPTHRVATRVSVPALSIDLPVMRQLTQYPACGVAMYLLGLKQPGQGGVTYLYAHAQRGMFLRLLEESWVNDGQRMLGMSVIVYTGDNLRFVYRIQDVRRHVTTIDGAHQWQGEAVFLQTSEGRGIPQKLQVVATFVSVASTDYASAHPVPRPRSC